MRNILLAALMAFPASAAPLIINSAWLAAHRNDPDLVLLHVGDKKEYAPAHIPGARFVSLGDISVSEHSATGLMLQMPAADDLRQRLEHLGVSDGSRIVVYYGKDWVSPATRVIFTLDYAGLGDRVSLLDGGMGAWVRAGNEVTAVVPPQRDGKLSPLKVNPIVVDADYVNAHRNAAGFAVVDGRDRSFYDGVEVGEGHAGPHKVGHIAGAHSLPFTEITDEQLNVRSQRELAALFIKAGVKPDDTVVGYCHIGQQATAMLFAARLTGHRVLLYDGSFEDWSRHDQDYPVAK